MSNDGTYVFFKQEYYYSQDGFSEFFVESFKEDFRKSKFSLCTLNVHSENNKAVFGTFNGQAIFYDLFSR